MTRYSVVLFTPSHPSDTAPKETVLAVWLTPGEAQAHCRALRAQGQNVRVQVSLVTPRSAA